MLAGYRDAVDEIRVADLNQEIVQAHLLEAGGPEIDQSVRELSRVELAERLGLVKSGTSGLQAQVSVSLPQVFLTVTSSEADGS